MFCHTDPPRLGKCSKDAEVQKPVMPPIAIKEASPKETAGRRANSLSQIRARPADAPRRRGRDASTGASRKGLTWKPKTSATCEARDSSPAFIRRGGC